MEHEIQTRKETGKIEKAIHKIEKEIPSLKSVLDAFKEIFIGRTLFKANLADLPDIHIPPPDPFQFSQGVPLLSGEMLSRFIDSWEGSVDFMIPYIEKGFPKIKPELNTAQGSCGKGSSKLKRLHESSLERSREKDR